jgi:hypothetical protein
MSSLSRREDIGISIKVQGNTGPKMKKLMKQMPLLVDKAIRITAARHRKRMVRWIRRSNALQDKKMLDGKALANVKENAKDGFTRSKHIHRSKRALSGRRGSAFWNTIRYNKISHGVYQFGFITPSSEFFADIMARGLFMNPLTKQTSNTITPSMKRYLGALGIATNKNTIKMPKRAVVEDYYKKHKHLIYRDINNVFNSFVRSFNSRDIA